MSIAFPGTLQLPQSGEGSVPALQFSPHFSGLRRQEYHLGFMANYNLCGLFA